MKLSEAIEAKNAAKATIDSMLEVHRAANVAIGEQIDLWKAPIARAARALGPVLGVGVALGEDAHSHKVAIRLQRHAFAYDIVKSILDRFDPDTIDFRDIGIVHAANEAIGASFNLGRSISHYLSGAGTAACEVRDLATGDRMLLSNNHVIAYENDAQLNDEILHPGNGDGAGIVCARYVNCIKMVFGGINYFDAAVAKFEPGFLVPWDKVPTPIYDPTQQPVDVTAQLHVQKIGRTTGHTIGVVKATSLDNIFPAYQSGSARFDDQIEVSDLDGKPFADRGDSGALVTDMQGRAVGLLFAVAGSVTFVNPIAPILKELNIKLA